MTDTYLTLVNSGVTKTLATKLGLPRPAPLLPWEPVQPLVTGPVLVPPTTAVRVCDGFLLMQPL